MNDNPLEAIAAWLEAAQSGTTRRNPLAIALATCSSDGRPAVRMVLLRGFSAEHGHIVFYTHFGSRKGTELDTSARAAAVCYWEEFGGRQLRLEGPVSRSPDAESDRYFATRSAASQLNAWVSEQSRPLEAGISLTERAARKAAEFGLDIAALDLDKPAAIPRPAHWGGYRLHIERVEFWSEGAGRFHDRRVYERLHNDSWRLTRLQP